MISATTIRSTVLFWQTRRVSHFSGNGRNADLCIISTVQLNMPKRRAGRKYIYIRWTNSAVLILFNLCACSTIGQSVRSLDDNTHRDRFILGQIIYHAHVIPRELFVISINRSTTITSKLFDLRLFGDKFYARIVFNPRDSSGNIVRVGKKSRIFLNRSEKNSNLNNTVRYSHFLKLFVAIK